MTIRPPILQLPAVDPAHLAVAIRAVLAEDRARATTLRGGMRAKHAPPLLELGWLAASVDGFEATERALMMRLLESLDEALDHAELEQQLADLDAAVASDGRAAALQLAADAIDGPQRDAALAFAAGIAMADGWLGEGELGALGEVAAALGLSDERAHDVIQDLVHRVEDRLG